MIIPRKTKRTNNAFGLCVRPVKLVLFEVNANTLEYQGKWRISIYILYTKANALFVIVVFNGKML